MKDKASERRFKYIKEMRKRNKRLLEERYELSWRHYG
jgi:hypothetical protein